MSRSGCSSLNSGTICHTATDIAPQVAWVHFRVTVYHDDCVGQVAQLVECADTVDAGTIVSADSLEFAVGAGRQFDISNVAPSACEPLSCQSYFCATAIVNNFGLW